jgi:hypothetical protein
VYFKFKLKEKPFLKVKSVCCKATWFLFEKKNYIFGSSVNNDETFAKIESPGFALVVQHLAIKMQAFFGGKTNGK